MRYKYLPEELQSYNPTWINKEFLQKGRVEDNCLKVGNASYRSVYIDAGYLDYALVERLSVLADSGLKIVLKKVPEEPGE